MCRSAPFLLLLALSTGCAAASSALPSTPAPTAVAGGPLALGPVSERVGEDVRLVDTHHFPDAGAGIRYRYGSPCSALQPDVFVYPLSETAAAAGSDPSAQARAESEAFKQVLAIRQQQGHTEAFRIEGEGPLRIAVGGHTLAGWHVHAVLVHRGQQSDTHQHLFAVSEQLIKVRTTFPRGSIAEEEVNAFLHALLREWVASVGNGPA